MQGLSWEPLPQRTAKRHKGISQSTGTSTNYNTEIEENIKTRSERIILAGTLEGLDGVRNEFYECL